MELDFSEKHSKRTRGNRQKMQQHNVQQDTRGKKSAAEGGSLGTGLREAV